MTSPEPSTQATPPPLMLSTVVWSIPAIFYLFAFLRSSPAVMTTELMTSCGIGAKDLGSLGFLLLRLRLDADPNRNAN